MTRSDKIPNALQKEFDLFIKENIELERDDNGKVTHRAFPAFLECTEGKDQPVFASSLDNFSGLKNNNELMPFDTCEALGLPLGAVYSDGVRVLSGS